MELLLSQFSARFNSSQITQKVTITLVLVMLYLALWYGASALEYAPFASLWFAPAGLSVAILVLWKNDGFLKLWICVWSISMIVADYPSLDADTLFNVFLTSATGAFAHTIPYWLIFKLFLRMKATIENRPDSVLLSPVIFIICLLIASLSASILGIGAQMLFADMSISTAQDIWLSRWIGDYVGAIILSPLFIFIGSRYLGSIIEPEKCFLINHSESNGFFPVERISIIAWLFIVLAPSIIAIARVKLDSDLPIVLAFLLVLLPISLLSTRNSWGVMISCVVGSSLLTIITIQTFGLLGDAIEYQTSLLAVAVTSLYFYDMARNFELKAQELFETRHSLGIASSLLTLNEIGANIAHELSTPLQTALSSSQRVRRRLEKRTDDWTVEIDELNSVKEAVNQANKTIVAVRSLVTPPDPGNSQCTISDGIALALQLSESSAKKHFVKLQVGDIPQRMHVKIQQSELTQILLNLISNGLRSALQSPKKIVSINIESVNESSVSLMVCDSGNGVDQELVPNLFKFGYSQSDDGLGIGLWTSKSIAERQGGRLEYIYINDEHWYFRLTLQRLEH